MARYKYDSPLEWLHDAAKHWDETRLYQELVSLASDLDSDTLQDRYQHDMEGDGYFRDLDKPAPCLYILDRDGEATDTLFFCSEECRAVVRGNTEHTVKDSESSDWIEGTVCDECGGEL